MTEAGHPTGAGHLTDTDRRFAADAQAHRRDLPRFCPSCGAALNRAEGSSAGRGGLAVEYWVAADRVFYCWCGDCKWSGEIIPTGAGVVSHEPEH